MTNHGILDFALSISSRRAALAYRSAPQPPPPQPTAAAAASLDDVDAALADAGAATAMVGATLDALVRNARRDVILFTYAPRRP
jgi:hypothetical protein